MLVLSRKFEEVVVIDLNGILVEIKVLQIKPGVVRLGFKAPQEVKITRAELITKNDQGL